MLISFDEPPARLLNGRDRRTVDRTSRDVPVAVVHREHAERRGETVNITAPVPLIPIDPRPRPLPGTSLKKNAPTTTRDRGARPTTSLQPIT